MSAVDDLIRRTRTERGLPAYVQDERVIANIARLVGLAPPVELEKTPPGRGRYVESRPARRMPTCKAVARHHGYAENQCWRCLRVGYVEKAHLVDRVNDGLDGVQNLSLLCHRCHQLMPSFSPDQEVEAKSYAMPDDPGPLKVAERIAEIARQHDVR